MVERNAMINPSRFIGTCSPVLAILILVLTVGCLQAQRKLYYSTHIQVTETSDYCGGAAPSEHELEERSRPQPYIHQTFYIISGKQNKYKARIIKKVETNDSGYIDIKLPKGIYSLVEEYQTHPFAPKQNDQYTIWNNDCLRSKWKQPLLVLNVVKPNHYTVNVHRHCFYRLDCMQYTGPLPP